jgi:hypothetical protein
MKKFTACSKQHMYKLSAGEHQLFWVRRPRAYLPYLLNWKIKKSVLMVQSLTKTDIICTFINGIFTPKYCKHTTKVSRLSTTVQFYFRSNSVPRTIRMHASKMIKVYTLKCRNNNTKVIHQIINIMLDKKCFQTHHITNAHQC